MKASDIIDFHEKFKKSDWPESVLDKMNSNVLIDGVFVLRDESGIPMWPSALAAAHVREDGNSRHSTQSGTRLSDATDMHVSSYYKMIEVMLYADNIDAIGGIGIYFNTNTPMLHLDMREGSLLWLCTKNGEYIYRENDIVKFYDALGKEL